jgi:hypothetical protein
MSMSVGLAPESGENHPMEVSILETLNALLGGLGLAFAAGLNAYIPLLMLGLASRFLPGDMVVLAGPFRFLGEDWCLLLLGALLVVEILADKIPVVDHLNDIVGTLIRPAAGAVLFAAGTGTVEHIDPRLAMALGFIAAGSVHGLKMAFRPFVTATTGGVGNPVVSFVEDVVSFLASLFALLLPIAALLLMVGLTVVIVRRLKRRRARDAAQPMS